MAIGAGPVSNFVDNLDLPAFSYYRRLSRVRRFVLQCYSDHITLADAARVAGMERSAFSSFFHRSTGVCYHDWVATIRVAKAMELMARSNVSVREVGSKVGYPKVRSFERVFLRMTGSTPIQFKTSVRPTPDSLRVSGAPRQSRESPRVLQISRRRR